MIDAKKDNVFSLILYSQKTGPRYFEIHKFFPRFFFLILPMITIGCICIILLGILYFKQLNIILAREETESFSSLKRENALIRAQLVDLQKINKDINEKLITPSESEQTDGLSIFRKPINQKDLTQRNLLSLEGSRLIENSDNLRLQFRIVNNAQNNIRLSGFLFVIMKSNNSYTIWPKQKGSSNEIYYNFNEGEFFSTARFRPVNIVFPFPQGTEKPLFQAIIFSRIGDIFYNQEIF